MSRYSSTNPLIYTIIDKCRMCYTCVRECPAKALKIENGQAEIISERCIACGNCVKVCSQGAKVYHKSVDQVLKLLSSEHKTIACVAPSYPAEFSEFENYKEFVGLLKNIGFDYVIEVAFGADLVANEYKELLKTTDKTVITSDCPVITFYVRQYNPELLSYMAPIVSPMVATARVLREMFNHNAKIVFIGPCIAKKAESDEIDEVLTFVELREIFSLTEFKKKHVLSDFDKPFAGKGAIFPVSRGLMQTAGFDDDIINGNVINADGRVNFREALDEFEKGNLKIKHLELLCCEGCISGPGMTQNMNRILRRTKISNYVNEKDKNFNVKAWEKEINKYSDINLSTSFIATDCRKDKPNKSEIDKVLKQMGKESAKDHLNCGACGYLTCEEHAIAVIDGLAENEMCLPYAIEKLHNSIDALHISNEKLAGAKQALHKSEKLASMGQLSAGIAHELNNPLGIITMYCSILEDEISLDDPLREDLDLIFEQANRCKKIVSGLLNFARKNQLVLNEVDIERLVKHSLNSIIVPDNISTEVNSKLNNQIVRIDADQMMQVLTNIEKNAIEAMPDGGSLQIEIDGGKDEFELKISDSGNGITDKNIEKLFTPFFTTKGPGKGTGLGLALAYGIIKMHKGKIDVSSNSDKNQGKTGTTFRIVLPKRETNV
ncbi:MAG: histidine kinase [Bacteroidetes bacterium]|nr:MAG: histidine kinase [Bacteroidota bacterium]